MAGMYDDMSRDELVQEILRWKQQAGRNANTCLRYKIALMLARKFGIASRGFEASVSMELADWFDHQMDQGVPWPSSPIVRKWLTEQGYSEVSDGRVGMRATMTIIDPQPVKN
jgi:hypothetical protein